MIDSTLWGNIPDTQPNSDSNPNRNHENSRAREIHLKKL